MIDGEKINQLYLSSLKFSDVPKPIILKKSLKNLISLLNPSEYLYPRLELNINDLQENELEEKLRHPLYVEFCSKEKIPFRVAYEHDDFFIISRSAEENILKNK